MEKFNVQNHVCRKFNVHETIQQMKYPDLWTFFSWGASKFINHAHEALQFWVRGAKHRGYVYIVLNGLDLYDVFVVSSKGNLKEKVTDIYFDDLQRTIDGMIERDRTTF